LVGRVRVARRLAWIGTAVCLAGCYTMQPARQLTPEPGSVIALDISDQGRVALGGLVGPELARVEGRFVSVDSSAYVLRVTGVRFLRGGEQGWSGETVRIKPEHVSSRYERKFSVVRTVALSALAVGAVALMASKGLRGFNQSDRDVTPGDTAIKARLPLPIRF
jgi:hypothetical protein